MLRRRRMGASRRALVLVGLIVTLVFVGCSDSAGQAIGGANGRGATLPSVAPSSSVAAFDPSVGAPLPNNRIVAAYGIMGGFDVNGPASTLDLLNAYFPTLQQLGQQYGQLDPLHPVKLALDLVVNVIQPCAYFQRYCSSWPDDASMQAYVDFCKQHNLLLFFDLQLGTEPVKDAVLNHLETYLEKYPFVELALDTEFHFHDDPNGYSEAAAYPDYTGCVGADEVNWAVNQLATISLQNRLPRKVLLLHQFRDVVFSSQNPCTAETSTKSQFALNPNVSIVLQADGFGGYDNKLSRYQQFVQQEMVEYGGYKLFYHYSDSGSFDFADYSNPQVQTPDQVMQLFPQPLFISYQ